MYVVVGISSLRPVDPSVRSPSLSPRYPLSIPFVQSTSSTDNPRHPISPSEKWTAGGKVPGFAGLSDRETSDKTVRCEWITVFWITAYSPKLLIAVRSRIDMGMDTAYECSWYSGVKHVSVK